MLFLSLYRFRSENGDAADDQTRCCKLCACCTPCYASALCLPCRRLRKINCCKRHPKDGDEPKIEPITTILNETETKARDSCWKRMKCCNRKAKQAQQKIMDEVTTIEQQTMQTAQAAAKNVDEMKRGKCMMCLQKVFCCRKTNKVQTTGDVSDADDEQQTCCACFPRRKPKEPMAWAETRQDSLMSNQNMPKKYVLTN